MCYKAYAPSRQRWWTWFVTLVAAPWLVSAAAIPARAQLTPGFDFNADASFDTDADNRWEELIEYCHMVVMTRPGTMLPDQGELADFIGLHRVLDATALEQHATGLLFFHPVSQLEISGTRIREQLAAGQDPGFLLPDPVIDIINKEGLYATGNRHEA